VYPVTLEGSRRLHLLNLSILMERSFRLLELRFLK
jgi:hypothetical protein